MQISFSQLGYSSAAPSHGIDRGNANIFLGWRAEGSEHTPPTIVIEGVEELVEVLRAA